MVSPLDRLVESGYSQEEAERILGLLPIASHNQRGAARC